MTSETARVDRHVRQRVDGGVGLAVAALVEIDEHEVIRPTRAQNPGERQVRLARPPGEVEEDRLVGAGATDHDRLVGPAQPDAGKLRDAARDGGAARIGNGRRGRRPGDEDHQCHRHGADEDGADRRASRGSGGARQSAAKPPSEQDAGRHREQQQDPIHAARDHERDDPVDIVEPDLERRHRQAAAPDLHGDRVREELGNEDPPRPGQEPASKAREQRDRHDRKALHRRHRAAGRDRICEQAREQRDEDGEPHPESGRDGGEPVRGWRCVRLGDVVHQPIPGACVRSDQTARSILFMRLMLTRLGPCGAALPGLCCAGACRSDGRTWQARVSPVPCPGDECRWSSCRDDGGMPVGRRPRGSSGPLGPASYRLLSEACGRRGQLRARGEREARHREVSGAARRDPEHDAVQAIRDERRVRGHERRHRDRVALNHCLGW